jgi:hypothetical protein
MGISCTFLLNQQVFYLSTLHIVKEKIEKFKTIRWSFPIMFNPAIPLLAKHQQSLCLMTDSFPLSKTRVSLLWDLQIAQITSEGV